MDLSKYWTLGKLAEAILGESLQGPAGQPVACIAIDTRTLKKGELFWVLEGARDGNDFVPDAAKKGAMGAVVTGTQFKSLPEKFALIRVRRGLSTLGKFAEKHRLLFPKLSIAAITGSNGKTTTKEMIAKVLSEAGPTTASPANFNNEIGCPLSMLETTAKHAYAVWEMAARKPGDIAALTQIAHPTVAVLTNISSAHLETFGSEEKIFQTKSEILRGLSKGNTVIYWAEDPWLAKLPNLYPGYRYLTFGFGPSADVQGHVIATSPEGTDLALWQAGKEVAQLRLRMVGRGPVLDALAAFACGFHFSVPLNKIVRALERVAPPAMRGETISLAKGAFDNSYVAVNDAYNANPVSMQESVFGFLQAYKGWSRIVVLGEMRELGKTEEELHLQTGQEIARALAQDSSLDDRTAFVVVGQQLAGALAAGLKSVLEGSGVQIIHTLHANAPAVLKKAVFRKPAPCAIFFKASRAEALETLLEELKGEF